MRTTMALVLVASIFAATGAGAAEERLVLPAGDAERGRSAFLVLRCNSCHRVAGVEMPGPVASPPVPITLGEAPSTYTDAQLVTAIINPSHSVTRAEFGESVGSPGASRMGDYNSVMTVRQLVDIVTFLRKHARK